MKYLKNLFLFAVCFLMAQPFANAQSVNYYPSATIATAGGNATVVPYTTPGFAESITATANNNFKGLLHVDKTTGSVLITNAYPAGNYTITVRFFQGGSPTITTFLLTVGTYTACNKASFGNAANATSGMAPVSIAVGDFNNDSRQDLIIANSGNNTVSVKLGDGSGGFLHTTTVATGAMPVAVAVNDFNGDGKQDIAVANKMSNTVSIQLGNGAGGFTGTIEIPVGTGPQAIVAGNFNNDGIADIATANGGINTVSIRLGNGLGGFFGTTEVPVGTNPYSIAAGDFNNDNNLDIATANFGTNTVSVRLGNGSGSFTAISDISTGLGPRSILIGDFNSDNNPDFITLNNADDTTGSSNSFSIRYGNGAGTFPSNLSIGISGPGLTSPMNIASGDFNSDGKTDFAVTYAGGANVSILLANTNNRFTLISKVPTGISPFAIAIGDFDQDGRQDFAATDTAGAGAIAIRLSGNNEINVQGNGITIPDGDTIPSVADFTDLGDVTVVDTATYTIQNSGPANLYVRNITVSGGSTVLFRMISPLPIIVPPGSTAPFSIRFTPTSLGLKKTTVTILNDDCDEDTYDFTIQANVVASTPTIGSYAGVTIPYAGGNAVITSSAIPSTNTLGITATTTADFKGLLQVNLKTGALTITNAHPAGTYPVTVKAYNGYTTVSTSFTLMVGNAQCSNSRFRQADSIKTSGIPQSVAVSDFNNDGYQDLAYVNTTANTVSIRYGNGAGGFSGTTTLSTSVSPFSIATGDFNGDGWPDFVTAHTGSAALTVWLGSSTRAFSLAYFTSFASSNTYSVTAGDFNNDGKPDLAVASGNNTVGIRLNDGEGNFGGTTNIVVGALPYAVAKGDFNGDGNLDFAAANYNGTSVSVRLGDGTGAFSTVSDVTTGSKPISLAVGDFNSDGKSDLAVANSSANTISICLGNGTGSFTVVTNLPVESSPATIVVADFNGDGKQDIATGLTGNAVVIHSGDGAGNFIYAGKVTTNGPCRTLAVGDFNNDGRQDFASGNAGVNTISIHLGTDKEINVQGNGTTIINGNNIPDTTRHTDFGRVSSGSTFTRTFTIQNTGTDTLTINTINLTGTDSLQFAVSGVTLPATVLPGAFITFSITFTATGNGIKTARVNIVNNDCDEPIYNFAIRGTAVCTPLATSNVWLGNTVDWNGAGNWSLGSVPTACTKVVVNTGVPFMPQISTTASCYSLTVNNGATFTVTGSGSLTITGP